jgi:opacity protein-like surface antigen
MAKLAAAFLASSVIAGTAIGADLDAEIAREAGVTMVEYGSGWYLRGDIGTMHGAGETFFPGGGTTDMWGPAFGETLTVNAGVGYIFNDRFRMDVTLSNADGFGFDGVSSPSSCGSIYAGECYYESSGTLSFMKLEANAYLSLTERNGLKPYIGAGAGLARVTWDDYSSRLFCLLDPTENCSIATHSGGPGQETWYSVTPTTSRNSSMAATVAVMAGFDYRLSEKWVADFGYKFTHVFDVGWNTGADQAEVESANLHEFRVGLRYEIW